MIGVAMGHIELQPEPGILIESLRDIGYSFNSALADIVDNSITAGATNVSIWAIPTDDDFQITIVDDGEGLSRGDLLKAMRLGSTDPRQRRAANDLGRFGLGLKTASFSQCRRLTVASRCGGERSAFTWDLDVVVRDNDWTLIERSDDDDIPFLEKLGETGTLVLWERVDRLTGSHGSGRVDYARMISEAQKYLSLVFHRYLSGERGIKRLNIFMNEHELTPTDPFNLQNSATQVSPSEVICPGVTMQVFTLPHRSFYESQLEYEKFGLDGGYLKNQGVYLYRAKRLILHGTWFGITKKSALTQLTRVKIDIDVNQDETWKIDVKKVSAQAPEVVRNRIRSLIQTIGAPSKRAYRRRAVRLTNPDAFPIWNFEKQGSERIYSINRSHPVIRNLRESLDGENRKQLDTVLALVESTFPKESLFYEFAQDEQKVRFQAMSDDDFALTCRTFFSSLKSAGVDEQRIVDIMRGAEPFASNWQSALDALGIKEEQ